MKTLLIVDVQNDFLPGGPLEVKDGDKIIDPINDIETINTELQLADIETLETKKLTLEKKSKQGDKNIINQIKFGTNKLIKFVYEKFKNSFNFPPKKLNLKIILLDK